MQLGLQVSQDFALDNIFYSERAAFYSLLLEFCFELWVLPAASRCQLLVLP